jgi:hypothetical protein
MKPNQNSFYLFILIFCLQFAGCKKEPPILKEIQITFSDVNTVNIKVDLEYESKRKQIPEDWGICYTTYKRSPVFEDSSLSSNNRELTSHTFSLKNYPQIKQTTIRVYKRINESYEYSEFEKEKKFYFPFVDLIDPVPINDSTIFLRGIVSTGGVNALLGFVVATDSLFTTNLRSYGVTTPTQTTVDSYIMAISQASGFNKGTKYYYRLSYNSNLGFRVSNIKNFTL